ncbi:hypothetical protein TNIN_41851 [Trichonephila inaurata madagascariensis]|uniref:Uncharacterized protein n=1 Tax=Trichonephila inaurata madagascariensis TaxID=2747483 RepID=A0A8X6YNG0_9ARAC|nr:hypothetical protein TNIN_41851 [Trichonephila inaurata madagascariensis]
MDLLFYTLILYSNKNKTKTLGNYRTFLIPPLLFPRKPPPLKFQISKEIESISSNKSYYRKQHNCPEAKALVPEYRGVGHERSPSLGPKPVISPCHAKPEGGGARRDAEQRAIDTVRLLKVSIILLNPRRAVKLWRLLPFLGWSLDLLERASPAACK